MSNLTMKQYGLLAAHDSGVPDGSDDYTTLVILHGFAWYAGVFARLLPLAQKYNTRIVLVNRRDYPGSDPLGVELHQISSITPDTPNAIDVLKEYMKQRARELYDFLELFAQSEKIPAKGGLVIAGWSFGGAWITAFLANVPAFPVAEVCLAAYIRRLVLYDPPFHALGYPPPANAYHPLSDPTYAPEEGVKAFSSWVSGYYSHGNCLAELEQRKPVPDPRPTIETMSPSDISSAFYPPAGSPGGSDTVLLQAGAQHGLFSALREASLYPAALSEASSAPENDWSSIGLSYVWCDRSVWEMPWGTWALQNELEEAKRTGRSMRPVQIVRVKGANHFAHWDQPEQALKALLADDFQENVIANR